jgi:ureidoacrylate peracid hydrolase
MVTFDEWIVRSPEPVEVPTAEHTALIVVDMQNAFTHTGASLGSGGLDMSRFVRAVPGCRALIDAAHATGALVVLTRYVHLEGHADGQPGTGLDRYQPPAENFLAEGTWDIEIDGRLAPEPGDIVIDKSRPSSFYGTRLEPLLSARKIRTVLVCGVTTNICVETTAREASQRGYDTFVIEDATAEFEQSRHDHAMYTIAFAFGTVATVADVQRSWGLKQEMPPLAPSELSVAGA